MNSSPASPPAAQISTSGSGEPYLKFRLDPHTWAVLAMEYAQEVLVLSAQRITPMPNMPPAVLGLLNWRSRVLWVVDLAHMLQLQPLEANVQKYNLAIVRVGELPLALAVQQVEGVTRLAPDTIQSPIGTVTSGLIPFLQGCILQQQETSLALDAEAIVRSPSLNPITAARL